MVENNKISGFYQIDKGQKAPFKKSEQTLWEKPFSRPGFYKKSVENRIEDVADYFGLSQEEIKSLKGQALDMATADNMIENVIGSFELPLGLALNLKMNGKGYAVPVAVEEPSIVAALSYSNKIIAASGGFKAKMIKKLMIGQIQLLDIEDFDAAKEAILGCKAKIIELANSTQVRLVNRGGGCRDIEVRIIRSKFTPSQDFMVVHLLVDCCEAMGANLINTMNEAVAPYLAEISGGKFHLRILSNLATESLVLSQCEIPFENLHPENGLEIAERIQMASFFAEEDPYRAATHNKGIFNGIDALAIASGNDWRAIEAGGHAYAALDGHYKPLATWRIRDNKLCGTIKIPLAVGTVGGPIKFHKTVKIVHKILGNPDRETLSCLLASVGMAQNFGAIKALATVGIQRGHMSLHARSVAITADVPNAYIAKVVEMMIRENSINAHSAKRIYEALLQQH